MQDFLSQFESVWAFTGLVLGFSFLIFIHELGHHVVAKWVGIKVTQFAIGFGPGMIAWRKGMGFRWGSTESEYEKRITDGADAASMGETEYRLNWVPLGGYVKMLGQEDLNPEAASEDERSFGNKPIWARACVVSAGVVMNMIFGVIFFIVAFMAGVEFPPAIVGSVKPDSPAAQTHAMGHETDPAYQGLHPGDQITHIDKQVVTDFADVAVNTALSTRGQPLRLTVEREGEPNSLVFQVTPKEDPNTQLLALGVGRPISLTIADPEPDRSLPGALADHGVQPGMQVTQVAGQNVKHYEQFNAAISQSNGLPLPVKFTDPVTQRSVDVELAAVPRLTLSDDGQPNLLGLVPAIQIPRVISDSPAAQAGMQAGDILTRIGPIAWPTWDQVIDLVQHAKQQPLRIAVLRDGEKIELEPITPTYKGTIGIYHGLALGHPIIALALPDHPFAQLNLNAGSRILSINGKPVETYGDIQRHLADAVNQEQQSVKGVDRDDATANTDTITVAIGYQINIANAPPSKEQVRIDTQWAEKIATAQWDQPLGPMAFKMLLIRLSSDNPIDAAQIGIKKAQQVMLQTYITLLRLFQGTVKPSHLRGPLGIADDGTNFAKQGWSYLMFFLGLISINLVVINFLPIPIVDGGLMVFLIIEKLKGSPVSVRIQTAATAVGLAMIGSVFLLTLFYDAKRLLGL